jgi:hypothetical protein
MHRRVSENDQPEQSIVILPDRLCGQLHSRIILWVIQYFGIPVMCSVSQNYVRVTYMVIIHDAEARKLIQQEQKTEQNKCLKFYLAQ